MSTGKQMGKALNWLLAIVLCPVVASAADGPAPAARVASGAKVALSLHQEPGRFTRPVLLTHAGDGSGRRFVVEQGGTVRLLGVDDNTPPYLDLTSRVRAGGERGLLGLAFHPNFARNRRLFVYYTGTGGDIILGRLIARAGRSGTVDSQSLTPLLQIENPATNHNGGMIAFGPDGYLYMGTGDGGGAGDPYQTALNSYSLLGKLLRLDVNPAAPMLPAGAPPPSAAELQRPYRIPQDNPFVGRSTYRPEIWAYGLRNPWRFSFDRANGDLFIADVGQDHWEEINYQSFASRTEVPDPTAKKKIRRGPGANYGWSRMEGRHCYPPRSRKRCWLGVPPVAEYSHKEGCSVTGGYVYRGKAIPKLVGTYLFADYCSGTIWGLTAHKTKPDTFRMKRLLETELSISGFGEDESGEVYVMDHRGGRVYRVVPEGWKPPKPPSQ